MSGDDRMRFCNQCNLHVYNISAMTREQVAALITGAEGRICARLYRRADGTVLTKDCPVGLRALRRRVSKVAGATLTALLSLCSGVFAQAQSKKDKTCTPAIAIKTKKATDKTEQGTLNGVVTDNSDGVVAGAKVTLINEQTGDKLKSVSTEEGTFRFSNLLTGMYSLEVEAKAFATSKLIHIKIDSDKAVQVSVMLEVKEKYYTMGILAVDEPIYDGNGTTTITDKMIQSLPHK
ncbi:MAG TPA: carboxypeptidase-like regulatory domain-containing protein [Pyrinomonadaceae bacterium]